MTRTEIKELIKENAGRPYYIYGLFYPGGNCFYVGKGQRNRIFNHLSGHSHNKDVACTIKGLKSKSKSPDCEIFTFALTERQALKIEQEYQDSVLVEFVVSAGKTAVKINR